MAVKPISELTDSSMKNLQTLIDSNSVIGKPITTPDGTTVLPVSRISFGFGTGGSDLPATQKELFGGGAGGGVSITPIAFLVIQNGNVKVLQVQRTHVQFCHYLPLIPHQTYMQARHPYIKVNKIFFQNTIL